MEHNYAANLRTRDAVKRFRAVLDVRVEIRPKLDQEERVLRPLLVQVFEAAFIGEFVVYLLDIDRLQERVSVRNRLSAYVHE